jgi:predicted cupin superfamily sugar epimerase
MHPRADELIHLLKLQSHPEGGHFIETFRSSLSVTPNDSRGARGGLTVIYFLLVGESMSRWHRVTSDEAWHWYEGTPLDLFSADPHTGDIRHLLLGPLTDKSAPQHVIPAGHWQAARPTGAYTLVGCSVGPGFDFSDFTLLASLPENERPNLRPTSLLAELV